MKAAAGALYGSTASFFTTDERYFRSIPIEADYNQVVPEDAAQQAPAALTAAAIGKLREVPPVATHLLPNGADWN